MVPVDSPHCTVGEYTTESVVEDGGENLRIPVTPCICQCMTYRSRRSRSIQLDLQTPACNINLVSLRLRVFAPLLWIQVDETSLCPVIPACTRTGRARVIVLAHVQVMIEVRYVVNDVTAQCGCGGELPTKLPVTTAPIWDRRVSPGCTLRTRTRSTHIQLMSFRHRRSPAVSLRRRGGA